MTVEALQREALLLQWWQVALKSDVQLIAGLNGVEMQPGIGLGNVNSQQLISFEQAAETCAGNAENLSKSVNTSTVGIGELARQLEQVCSRCMWACVC